MNPAAATDLTLAEMADLIALEALSEHFVEVYDVHSARARYLAQRTVMSAHRRIARWCAQGFGDTAAGWFAVDAGATGRGAMVLRRLSVLWRVASLRRLAELLRVAELLRSAGLWRRKELRQLTEQWRLTELRRRKDDP